MNFPHAAKIYFNCQKKLSFSYHKNFSIYIHGFIFYFLSKYSLIKYCAKTTFILERFTLILRKYWHYIRNFQKVIPVLFTIQPKLVKSLAYHTKIFLLIDTHPGFFPRRYFELFQQFLYFK